jgi:hypothetical protein
MKHELVAAFATNEITGTAPDWIMFAPAGKQQIQAKLDGKPSRLTITVDAEGAAALQRDLEARKTEGGPQPFFDLHHDAREAAAYPQEFEWREGSGIWARVIWTPMGLEATKCDVPNGILPSVRYFSPRCAVVRGRIVGLLDSSSGNAAGGLVSDPAFEKIVPLVAAKQTTQQDNMDKKRLMKALGKAEDAEMEDEDLMLELEAACAGYMKGKDMEAGMAKKVEEITASKAVVDSEVASLKTELEAARAEIGKVREAAADGFVAELVASGKIPPKAAGIHKLYRTQYLTDSAAALEAAKELTTAHAPDGKRLTDDQPAKTPENFGEQRAAKARELVASKSAPNFEAGWEMAGQILTAQS